MWNNQLLNSKELFQIHLLKAIYLVNEKTKWIMVQTKITNNHVVWANIPFLFGPPENAIYKLVHTEKRSWALL